MLETKLKTLFDYQRLEKDADLQSVIDEVLERYAQNEPKILSDDDLDEVAGGAYFARFSTMEHKR